MRRRSPPSSTPTLPCSSPAAIAAYLPPVSPATTPPLTPEPTAVPIQLATALRLHAATVSAFVKTQAPVSLHMQLLAQTMWELLLQALHALTVRPSLASALLSIVHECGLLLLSIPAVYNVGQLESVRLMSWLFANDCDLVACTLQRMHQLLAVECRMAHLPSTLLPALDAKPPPPSFVTEEGVRLLAVVGPLSSLSRKWRVHTLARLRDDTLASLAAVPSFAQVDDHRRLQAALHALQQASHQLLQQLRALGGVSTERTQVGLVRAMMGLVGQAVVQRVLDVKDISVEVGKGMERLLQEVNGKEVREAAGDVLQECGGWKRLEAVQLLIGSEQTLVKLGAQFDAGLFASLGKAEMQSLIAALYEDTAQRQQFLDKITRT